MEIKPWMVDEKISVNCKDCSAECCKHIAVQIEEPKTFEECEAIKWYIAHEGVSVYKDVEGDWLVEFLSKCIQLNGNRCMAWGTDRYPHICAEYEMSTCVMNEEGEYWEILFKKASDVDAYMRERGITQATRGGDAIAKPFPFCVAVPIDTPEEWSDFDDLRWYIAHRDVSIVIKDKQWYVHFNTLCRLDHGKHLCHQHNGRIPIANDGTILATWDDIESYCQSIGVTPKYLT